MRFPPNLVVCVKLFINLLGQLHGEQGCRWCKVPGEGGGGGCGRNIYVRAMPLMLLGSMTSGFGRFVCAHLTAHPQNLKERICDYHHIVGSLLFPPIPGTKEYSTMYATSNLFFLGDLNFRLDVPETHPMSSVLAYSDLSAALEPQNARTALKEFDQLYVERKKGSSFVAFREGEFWKFKCSYKYELGEVDKYRYAFL